MVEKVGRQILQRAQKGMIRKELFNFKSSLLAPYMLSFLSFH
jgi:hypothetical protein